MKISLATITAFLVHISLTAARPTTGQGRNGTPLLSLRSPTPQQTEKILNDTANILADALKVTLGPRGRNVVITRSFGCPMVTNDGISIAREVELEVQNSLGAAMVKEAAAKTSGSSDSSVYTTAEVLAKAMAAERLKHLTPADLKALQDCLKQ